MIGNSTMKATFLLLVASFVTSSFAFVSPTSQSVAPLAFAQRVPIKASSSSSLNAIPIDQLSSTNSLLLAAEPIDPAAAMGQAVGGLINSPAILAVPILAAFGVASLIAFLILAYANPADPDDE